MSSNRNKLLVKRGMKGVKLAPFSKATKDIEEEEKYEKAGHQEQLDAQQSTSKSLTKSFPTTNEPKNSPSSSIPTQTSVPSKREEQAAPHHTIPSTTQNQETIGALHVHTPRNHQSVKLSLSLDSTLLKKLKTMNDNSQNLSDGISTDCVVKCNELNDENKVSACVNEKNNSFQGCTNTEDDRPTVEEASSSSVIVRNVRSLKALCCENINQSGFTFLISKSTPNASNANIENNNQVSDVINTEDISGTDSGDEYRPKIKKRKRKIVSSSSSSSSSSSRSSNSSSSSSSSSDSSSTSSSASNKKAKKRKRNLADWQRNKRKTLKNSGKAYTSTRGKSVPAREMKPPCSVKCRLACSSKFNDEQRKTLFDNYWGLSSLQRQRDFLSSCLAFVVPTVRRIKNTNTEKPRKPNCLFTITENANTTRVCKQFLINTLGITERALRTVIEAKSCGSGIVPSDGRGKHSKHSKLDPEIAQSVRDHINSVPRVESHYLRANTSREFVDGGLSIAELHRNYQSLRQSLKKPSASYDMYARIFNSEFNISFFIPKKDQCDLCEAYKNAEGDDKLALQGRYEEHQEEKKMSRKEKKLDIQACKAPNSNSIVAIYDLQAVMPTPIGESSAFFYKSKLNCYNFTVCDVKNEDTDCFFWHEGLANRGAIEIGTCVFKFLQKRSVSHPNCDIIFFSDNCCGQQKNRFVFTMYYYALSTLQINSITHKFLVRGHTQNEGDNAHSLIEKAIKRSKRSGPICVPSQYVQIIRCAKKTGKPFVVHELDYDDFIDLKSLADDVGLNFSKDADGNVIKVTEIKCIKFVKNDDSYYYKTSYAEQVWKNVPIKAKENRSASRKGPNRKVKDIQCKPAYTSKNRITGLKKKHLLQLIDENIIPKQHKYFYDSLF